MGFNKSERKNAQAQQQEAFKQQQQVVADQRNREKAYADSFDSRNANIIKLQKESGDRLDSIQKGSDLGSIYPYLMNMLNQGSDLSQRSLEAVNNIGTYDQQDSRYVNKLREVSKRRIASETGRTFAGQAVNLAEQDKDMLSKTTQYLNADRQAGVGLTQQGVVNASGLFDNASQWRQSAIQEAQLGWQGFSSLMGLTTGVLAGIGTGGMSAGLSGMFKSSPSPMSGGFSNLGFNQNSSGFNSFAGSLGSLRR